MIKVIGNDLRRAGIKVGWIEGNDIRDHLNKKLGYFEGNDIRRVNGIKVGFMEGNNFYTINGPTIRIDDIRERHVVGGGISDLARAAIMILIGD